MHISPIIPAQLAQKVQAAKSHGQTILKEMKACCEPGIPFNLETMMESVIDVSSDCLKQMKTCYEYCEQLANLELYEKKGDSIMMMLILTKYSSKENFKNEVIDSLGVFHERLQELRNSLNEIDCTTNSGKYNCPDCQGEGIIYRWIYLRERGTPTQRVLRTSSCNKCEGTGYITIKSSTKRTLALFSEKTNTLFMMVTDVCNSMKEIHGRRADDAERLG